MKTIKFIYKLLRKNNVFGEVKSSTLYDLISEIQGDALEQYSKATNAKLIMEKTNLSGFVMGTEQIGTFSIENPPIRDANVDELARTLESSVSVKPERVGEYNDKKLDLTTLKTIE